MDMATKHYQILLWFGVLSLHSKVKLWMRTGFVSNILTRKDVETSEHGNESSSQEFDFCPAE